MDYQGVGAARVGVMTVIARVDYQCHECGQTHRVSNVFDLETDIDEAGSLDELYPEGRLPPRLERLMGDLVWCDQVGDYIELEDPARVFLTPRPPLPARDQSDW